MHLNLNFTNSDLLEISLYLPASRLKISNVLVHLMTFIKLMFVYYAQPRICTDIFDKYENKFPLVKIL